ncbi:hypothetical protein ASD66_17810 [Nocardioides sp. Root151]|nr:hypothetical protein ASD66_17810 [Nocardioides sp. Root151]
MFLCGVRAGEAPYDAGAGALREFARRRRTAERGLRRDGCRRPADQSELMVSGESGPRGQRQTALATPMRSTARRWVRRALRFMSSIQQ